MINWGLQDKNRQAFPPVVWRALKTFNSLQEATPRADRHLTVRFLFFILVLTVSYLIATEIDIKLSMVPAVLTALSILAGFIINLILSTGNQANFEGISHTEIKRVTGNIKHMLKFQIETFLTYLITLCLGLALFTVPWRPIQITFELFFLAGVVYSVARSLILPFQLYELHEYRMDIIFRKKQREAQADWEKMKKKSSPKISNGF